MKKLFSDFKKFVSRGNVIDLAVGMIIGAAFTAIVTALVNYILKPLIAWIPGADGLGALQVVLREGDAANGVDPVILDFGEVISAVITFFITAVILFIIVKVIVSVRDKQDKLRAAAKKAREDRLRAEGKLPPEEPVAEETPEEVKPTTEELLTQIRDLLAARGGNAAGGAEDKEDASNSEETKASE